jgi:hypothetical protein
MQREPSLERALNILGFLAKDVNTGFTGVVTAVTEYAYGCAHITLEPEVLDKEGALIKGYSFDEPRIEVLEVRDHGRKIEEPTIKVGNIVEDVLNGRQGFVTASTTWLFGPPDLAVEPTNLKSDGSPNELFFLPESRTKLIKDVPPKFAPIEDAAEAETPEPKPEEKPRRRTGGPVAQAPEHRRSM